MNKLKAAFAGGKTLVPFITCGDPDLQATAQNIHAAAENGAGMIALGIPFSDPTAEAPVLQEASIRALAGGVNTDRVFEFVKELRKTADVPMIFVTYANVVFSYGVERFAEACQAAEIDGLLIPDLPFEEREDFLSECEKHGVELIAQIALTSGERVEMIAKAAKDLVYISAGGALEKAAVQLRKIVSQVRAATDAPCLIDFDLANANEIAEIAALTDGIMISSATVELQAQYGADASEKIGRRVREIKAAMER